MQASKEFEEMTSPAQDDSHALTINSDAGWYAIPYGITKYNNVEPLVDGGDILDAEAAEDTLYTPEYEYEAGVLVFRADDTLEKAEPIKLGSEYLYRSVYIGDYIYALDKDGNCTSFKPEI